MSKPIGPTRNYWDANLFIHLVNGTSDRSTIIGSNWDDLTGRQPRAIAVTSALTITEVAYVLHEKELHRQDPSAIAKIDAFWAPSSPVELVELYQGIAYESRQMIRLAMESGLSLKPADAIHFATAKKRGCVQFFTYDDKLYKFNNTFGFAVRAPARTALAFES